MFFGSVKVYTILESQLCGGFLCNCLQKSFCCFFVCLSATTCRGVISLVFTSIISGVHRVCGIHGFGVQQTHLSSFVFTEHVVYMCLGATEDSFLDDTAPC
jgi:hypothetical protein